MQGIKQKKQEGGQLENSMMRETKQSKNKTKYKGFNIQEDDAEIKQK